MLLCAALAGMVDGGEEAEWEARQAALWESTRAELAMRHEGGE